MGGDVIFAVRRSDGMPIPVRCNEDGDLTVETASIELEAGDIQIGAVEIKDHDSDVRAEVDADGLEVHIDKELPAGTQNIGDVDIASALPAGTNNIGDVDIASFLASLPAGTNNIGDVDIVSALPVGGNLIGRVEEAATPVVTPATGSGAISASYSPSAAFWLESITVHLSSAPTTAGDLTATLNANDGPAYDTVLLSTDPSNPAATDIFWQPESPLLCEAGDAIDVAYANADGRTYGLRIVARLA